jgi:hypothetical protein
MSDVLSDDDPLRDYDGTYLECRDLRHTWTVVGYYRVGPEIHRQLHCKRCPTVRTDRWGRNGDRLANSYNYPDGYQIRGANVSPHDVRIETLRRVNVYASEHEMVQALFTRTPDEDDDG